MLQHAKQIVAAYAKLGSHMNQSKQAAVEYGPIGILINDLYKHGMALEEDLTIVAKGEPPIDIWTMPWQHLRKAVSDSAVRARVRHAAACRSHLQRCQSCQYQ